ncbi:MAG TPA: hypothetical protein VK727_02865 [Steroidobacteraceae bacterium]|nr:hypothetical protein [Steroidobacteraceae bacterium]
MTISQMAVVTANVVIEMPWPSQGEIEAKPSPDPSANKTSDTETAANAPAMMADQEAVDFAGAPA